MYVVMEYLGMVAFFLLVSWITIRRRRRSFSEGRSVGEESAPSFSEGRRAGEGSAQPCDDRRRVVEESAPSFSEGRSVGEESAPQFSTPRSINLIFNTQASGLNDGDVEVKVMGENDIFKAVRSLRSPKNSFRREVLLYLNDSLVISMQKMKLTSHSRWQAFKVRLGELFTIKKALFTIKKASALALPSESRTKLEVLLLENRRKEYDLEILGSCNDRGDAVHQANPLIVVAKMNAAQEEHHLFEMRINSNIDSNIDYCFIVCLAVILYEKYYNKGTYKTVIKMAKIAKKIFECAEVATGCVDAAISIISDLCGS